MEHLVWRALQGVFDLEKPHEDAKNNTLTELCDCLNTCQGAQPLWVLCKPVTAYAPALKLSSQVNIPSWFSRKVFRRDLSGMFNYAWVSRMQFILKKTILHILEIEKDTSILKFFHLGLIFFSP